MQNGIHEACFVQYVKISNKNVGPPRPPQAALLENFSCLGQKLRKFHSMPSMLYVLLSMSLSYAAVSSIVQLCLLVELQSAVNMHGSSKDCKLVILFLPTSFAVCSFRPHTIIRTKNTLQLQRAVVYAAVGSPAKSQTLSLQCDSLSGRKEASRILDFLRCRAVLHHVFPQRHSFTLTQSGHPKIQPLT